MVLCLVLKSQSDLNLDQMIQNKRQSWLFKYKRERNLDTTRREWPATPASDSRARG